eukprot:CAMPEP_0167755542 /NCGR_PEP_ID=MMETSP0110_2-20121227/8887_1 /TAXON_ID=629695 /ORGANISM="Gymnochlora sp., Strain CCMP2014" /LENGTH=259 /DNA_ID=CAMNT_0007641551 /DNA_START=52 /DNA_END=831 /DNA_ORIENTATION=+
MTEEYVYKIWPFNTELKLTKGDPVTIDKKAKESLKTAFLDWMALLDTHTKKKSGKGYISFDEIVLFCKDTKVPTLTDQDFGQLKFNKTTRLVEYKVWANVLLKPLTKKRGGTPPEYFKSLLDGVKAKTEEWSKLMKAAAEARAKEKALTNFVANLYISCENGETEKVKKTLTEKKEFLNYANPMRGKSTPFMAAAGKGKLEVCKELLELKADINAEDGFEWTALNWAVSSGDTKTEEFLKANGGELGAGEMEDEDEESD